MPRSSHEFFHGSAHPFKVGDVITPRNHVAAFATASADEAASYASYRAQNEGTLAGMVYSVTPLGPTKNDIGKVVTSRSGFKVTGVHSFAASA